MTVAARPVLVADHEPEVAELARRYLERAGLLVRLVSPSAAIAALGDYPLPVVVLDLTAPGLDIRRVRRAVAGSAQEHMVFLVDRHGAPPRGLGKHWLARPFSPRDLVREVTGLLRAAGPASKNAAPLAAGGLRLDIERRIVTVGGDQIQLTRTEAVLLAALLARPGQVLTRERLGAAVGGARAATPAAARPATARSATARPVAAGPAAVRSAAGTAAATHARRNAAQQADASQTAARRARASVPSGRAIDVHIAGLRAKLGPRIIRTARLIGYAVDPPGAQRAPDADS